MGLAEKRIAAAYEKDSLPTWKKKINSIAGYELAYDVAIPELVKEGYGDSYPKTIDYNFFMPLERSLTSICADDLGKEALKAKIKKIQIGSKRSWSSLEVKVQGDTLSLDADPSYQRDDSAIDDYAKRITAELESNL
jgi:hypothetical protein